MAEGGLLVRLWQQLAVCWEQLARLRGSSAMSLPATKDVLGRTRPQSVEFVLRETLAFKAAGVQDPSRCPGFHGGAST